MVTAFFGLKAYVMLPIVILCLSLAVRVPLRDAVFSTVSLSAGFAGVFVAFEFFVANISPAVHQLSQGHGLNFAVLDVGWPALAAITWASPVAVMAMPLILLVNLAMLACGATRTVYLDVWNYWHFALAGALVLAVTDSMVLGLAASALLAMYCFKMVEWTAPDVAREIGLRGVSGSPLSGNGMLPYIVCVDWLLDRIPVLKGISFNPGRHARSSSSEKGQGHAGLLGEPVMIGFIMGLSLGFSANYGVGKTLEMGSNIAASMFLLPKSAGLIAQAMLPVTAALRGRMSSLFPGRRDFIVAMDTGFMMSNKSVVAAGLVLMFVAIAMALLLPGNQVLPLGDLPNLISLMSVSVLVFRGNVFRAVLAGIPVVVSLLWISAHMAPLITDLARKAPSSNLPDLQHAGLMTAFTGGGNQLRFLVLSLFEGRPWAFAILPAVLAAMVVAWRRSRRVDADLAPGHEPSLG